MAQLTVIGALMAGATALNAQTNVDVTVNIALNGVVQNGDTATRGHITTRDVILAIKSDAAKNAKLVLRSTLGSGEQFLILEGTTETPADQLSTQQLGTPVTVETDKNGLISDKTVEIREFALQGTGGLTFDVQGYTTSTSNNKGLSHGETFDETTVVSASAKVSGTMTDASGNPGVVQGTISVGGRKIAETP